MRSQAEVAWRAVFFFLAQVFEGGNTVPSFSHAEGVVLEEEVPG